MGGEWVQSQPLPTGSGDMAVEAVILILEPLWQYVYNVHIMVYNNVACACKYTVFMIYIVIQLYTITSAISFADGPCKIYLH